MVFGPRPFYFGEIKRFRLELSGRRNKKKRRERERERKKERVRERKQDSAGY